MRAHVVFVPLALLVFVVTACTSGSNDAAPASDAGVARDATVGGGDDDAGGGVEGPALLSQTGLYSDFSSRTIAADVIPYEPHYAFWVDGGLKARWLWLPPGTKIDTSSMDDWVFPIGTKVWKELRFGGKVVETRLLMKVAEGSPGGWWMAAYVWRDDGSDAVATLDGATNALGSGHDVPTQVDCINCHQNVKDVLLGVSAIQLSGVGPAGVADAGAADAEAPDAGDAGDAGAAAPSYLMSLAAAGKLTSPPAADFAVPGTGVVKDALAYMHANCGNCHNGSAVRLATQTRMRLRLLVDQTAPEQTGAYTTTIGTVMKHPIDGATDALVPGSPEASGIWVRMGHRDYFAMPPVGTRSVDTVGRQTIADWITQLPH